MWGNLKWNINGSNEIDYIIMNYIVIRLEMRKKRFRKLFWKRYFDWIDIRRLMIISN